MTSLRVSSSRVSLRWILSAWFLFRSSVLLWMVPAAVLTISSLLCGLLVTGHLHPAARLALPLVHASHQLIFAPLPASLQPDKIVILVASIFLLLLALAANTAMTGMANRVVRGGTISARDLFRFGGFGATSLALGTTLLAAVAGSLVLFVGSIFALGLLLAAQSAAFRTRCFLPALRTSTSVIRSDPARTLVLAVFMLLTVALGIATAGLGLLVAIPVVKIIGAFADMFAEGLEDQRNSDQRNSGWLGKRSATLDAFVPPASTLTWTHDEELMLKRTAPPASLGYWVASGLVVLLSAYLLLPDMPAASVQSETTSRPESLVPSPQPDAGASATPNLAAGVPEAPATAAPVSSYNPASSYNPVSNYNAENPPTLPCRMQWGNYTVLIEQENSDEVIPPKKISVLDAADKPIYTITDEQIAEVRTESLLGGPQPELLIDTEEGGDGTHGIHMALTQQGGVHAVFFLSGQYAVRILHLSEGADEKNNGADEKDNGAGEAVVVDSPLDVPLSDVHHYPLLTSTYRWSGHDFENATQSLHTPTDDRVTEYEQDLATTTNLEEAERDTIGLLANMNILGMTRLSTSLVRSGGFQSGLAWIRANPQSRQSVSQAIADAKKSLPSVSSNVISSDSSPSSLP